MAETCIVCLGDLRAFSASDDPPPEAAEAVAAHTAGDHAKTSSRAIAKSDDADEENIAHLLPCKHDLHNSCLKPWVERANSCPICRAKFNMVEISQAVGGPVFDSYAVQDKVQESELDPGMIVEDELFAVEAWEPCMVCGASDDTHEMMYCDRCDRAAHVFCAGHEDTPEAWYCETCLTDLETDTELPGTASAMQRRPRRRVARLAPRRGSDVALWARVWEEVAHRIDLDLDFPFDDEPVPRHPASRSRRLDPWQRRAEAAQQQGAALSRIRDIATAHNRPSPVRVQPEPESQEEIRAWNAFEKARESQGASTNARGRKRKATASPASPHGDGQAEPTQLKRPRLRRGQYATEHHAVGESSSAAAQRPDERSTFLSSLLKDVETKPVSAGSPHASEQYAGHWSPRESSPARSPTSSGQGTPRALSPAPPLHIPISPPLSNPAMLASSPALPIFSPYSPTGRLLDLDDRGRLRQPRNAGGNSDGSPRARASSGSPSRNLSYSAKEEVQRMVKLALGPRYRDKEISKEQYTDINRDVSRKMYELVGDASALADQSERERWQGVAEDEVKNAIAVMHFGPRTLDD